ncbi:MAG: hypothetical protein ABIR47_13470, partial [Candidatus Kapaibacterium sp.]
MKRLLATMLCLSLFPFTRAFAQEWIKAYGGPYSDFAYNIYPTADGGFITAGGRATSNQQQSRKFWVARFDSLGNKRWDSTYGASGVQETIFGSGQTRDGGLIFGGFTGVQFSGSESALAYKIDSNGREEWHNEVNYSRSDHFHFFVERKEGGYYFGGHTDSKDDPQGDMWLIRYDSARNVVWEKTYDRGTGEHAHWAIETRDGGCLLVGHTTINQLEKYWVVKVDSNGTKQWDKTFSSGSTFDDSVYRVFETSEGNYAIIGGSSSSVTANVGTIWLLVIDTTGTSLINKHFGNATSESFAWSGRQTSDGGFIVAGYTTYKTHGGQDMYVVKTKKDGTLDWEEKIGGTGYDLAYDVIEVADGYVACGETGSGTIMTGGGGDMMLVKIKKAIPPPATVVLLTPLNGSYGLPVTTTLNWNASASAMTYRLQVADNNTFTSLIIDDSTLTSPTRTLGPLQTIHRYYWRVQARNPAGTSAWSSIWSFSIGDGSSVDEIPIMQAVQLSQNVPNPFSNFSQVR